MATAIIGGLINNGYAAQDITAVEISAAAREVLHARWQIQTASEIGESCARSDVIVLAVKPQQLKNVAQALSPFLSQQLVLSIAAGVRTQDLARWLGGYGLIVRAMPNTPALLRAGISALFALPQVDTGKKELAVSILAAVGKTLWLNEEAQMDAVTAVSGSGPAYVFYFMEAMQSAAEQLGLNRDQAILLSRETFLGAARLAHGSSETLDTLRGQVTSKGGTTEQALLKMEEHAIKQYIVEAILAAAVRSRQLGEELGRA